MKYITIITPTYNRSYKLINLYNSLEKQTELNFKWLIIDDGSNDNTKDIVQNFKQDKFEIKYVYKENEGKHTALNLAFDLLDTELAIIVDSDDTLITCAIAQIINDWEKYKKSPNICGLVYARMKLGSQQYICDHFREAEFEENYNNYVINQRVKGDKAEVFKSDILKKYKFPVFDGEKFIGEGVIWSQISRKYNMIFIDKAIYICDYLEGGLTKSGRKLRINNPYGGMYHAREYMDNIYSFRVREKNTILYMVYAKFAKIKFREIFEKNGNKGMMLINFVPSRFLYLLWKYKFGIDKTKE